MKPALDPSQFRCKTPGYLAAKAHAYELDRQLGFQCEAIEKQIVEKYPSQSDQELWIGKDYQGIQTPYSELVEVIERVALSDGSTWVDLGAGYGRMGLVIAACFPKLRFRGYEFVQERVNEARRVFPEMQIEQADLAAAGFEMPDAEGYFLYDFGTEAAIESVLEKLKHVARRQQIVAIGRGKRSRHLIDRRHPWLSGVHNPEHFETYSVYRSAG